MCLSYNIEYLNLVACSELCFQVLLVCQYIEDVALEYDIEVRSSFSRLLWAMKLLTLDSPGDIKGYQIPLDLFVEEDVRCIMSQRIDFSREAVSKVKIKFSEPKF